MRCPKTKHGRRASRNEGVELVPDCGRITGYPEITFSTSDLPTIHEGNDQSGLSRNRVVSVIAMLLQSLVGRVSMAELQPLWRYHRCAIERPAVAYGSHLLRLHSRVTDTLPRSLTIHPHVLVFLMLEN